MARSNQQQLATLAELINQLTEQAQQVDQAFYGNKWHQQAMEQHVFYQDVFQCQATRFLPYCHEITKEFNQLTEFVARQQQTFVSLLLDKISQQINALSTALNAVDLLQKEMQTQSRVKARTKLQQQNIKQQVKKQLQNLQQPTQNLYQQLAEYHDFERRLAAMILEQQRQVDLAKGSAQAPVVQKLLALQQRLGRCRKAINELELTIERAEKRL